MAAQLGHAKPTTTLAYYGHWLPRGDKGYIDRLAAARESVTPLGTAGTTDAEAHERRSGGLNEDSWHRRGTTRGIDEGRESKGLEFSGAGGGTRTHDLLITNQLLCH